jgi:hypothetical protein
VRFRGWSCYNHRNKKTGSRHENKPKSIEMRLNKTYVGHYMHYSRGKDGRTQMNKNVKIRTVTVTVTLSPAFSQPKAFDIEYAAQNRSEQSVQIGQKVVFSVLTYHSYRLIGLFWTAPRLHRPRYRANMPSPLPPNPYAVETPMHTAYSTCLALQAQAPHLQVPWAATPTPLVCARLLGYMIIHSPTAQGRTNICNEINSCNGDRDLFHNLAKFYVDRYLRSCKYLHAL